MITCIHGLGMRETQERAFLHDLDLSPGYKGLTHDVVHRTNGRAWESCLNVDFAGTGLVIPVIPFFRESKVRKRQLLESSLVVGVCLCSLFVLVTRHFKAETMPEKLLRFGNAFEAVHTPPRQFFFSPSPTKND